MNLARNGFTILLLFVGAVFAITANATVWANRTVFHTDQFVSTTNRVLDDDQVQEQLAVRLSATLIDQGQVEDRLRTDLPEGLKALAPVLTATARDIAHNIILRLLQNQNVRDGLDTALRATHQQVLKVIEDKGAVVVQDNTIVLDLRTILEQAADELNVGGNNLVAKANLPGDAGQVVLVEDAQTAGAIQQLLSLHNQITWLVIGIAVLAFALAVLVSPHHLATLRSAGIILLICGALAVVLLLPLRPIVAGLAQNPGAARAAFDAFFFDYRLQSVGLMLIGAAIIIVAMLLGDSDLAKAVRGTVRRKHGEPRPDLADAVRGDITGLRAFGLVVGALVLAAWPERTTRVYVATFIFLGLYLAVLWLVTSESEWAVRAREQLSAASGRVGGAAGEARNATFAGRHARQLRIAGIVGALIVAVMIPNFGIGALAGIVALTLLYLALVDWLATRAV